MSQGQGDVSILYDKNGKPYATKVANGEATILSSDEAVLSLLSELVVEVKELKLAIIGALEN